MHDCRVLQGTHYSWELMRRARVACSAVRIAAPALIRPGVRPSLLPPPPSPALPCLAAVPPPADERRPLRRCLPAGCEAAPSTSIGVTSCGACNHPPTISCMELVQARSGHHGTSSVCEMQ